MTHLSKLQRKETGALSWWRIKSLGQH